MKATGIVRRIDDLGRIVIPKEIRKTLKVKEGMPLEIYTDKEGGIILRKFLPFSEMSSLSEEFAQCVAQQMGNAVFVTDREKVVAAAGYTGEDIVGEPISHILENILDDRDERLPLSERNRFIPVIHGMEEHEQICQVIRSNGQIIGAIIIQARDMRKTLLNFVIPQRYGSKTPKGINIAMLPKICTSQKSRRYLMLMFSKRFRTSQNGTSSA